jgi:acyl carrier protein
LLAGIFVLLPDPPISIKGDAMATEETYAKLTEILRDTFDDDSIVARPELTAKQVDGWTSIVHVRLMITVEKAFGVRFLASQMAALKNVGDLAALIESEQARR